MEATGVSHGGYRGYRYYLYTPKWIHVFLIPHAITVVLSLGGSWCSRWQLVFSVAVGVLGGSWCSRWQLVFSVAVGVLGGSWCSRWQLVFSVAVGVLGGSWCSRWQLVFSVAVGVLAKCIALASPQFQQEDLHLHMFPLLNCRFFPAVLPDDCFFKSMKLWVVEVFLWNRNLHVSFIKNPGISFFSRYPHQTQPYVRPF